MAQHFSPRIVTEGMVLCLDAANTDSYSTGTNWNDLSGNANNGTLGGGASYSSNALGSINFNGTNGVCVGPGTIKGASGTQISLEIWTKPNSTTQTTTLMSKWGSSTLGNYSWLLFLNWFAQGNIDFLVGNAAGTSYSTHSIAHQLSTSSYSYFAVTYNAGSISMYRNGILISTSASANTTLKSVSTSLGIGHDYDFGSVDTPGRYYNGSIPTAKIYNKTLSITEVSQNFNATRGRYGV